MSTESANGPPPELSPAPVPRRGRVHVASARRNQDLTALVQGISLLAIFMLDRHGHVQSWNAGGEAITGYSPREIIGQHFSAFYTAEDAEAGKPEDALELASSNGGCEDEGIRVRKDGSHFWAAVAITPLLGSTDRVRGYATVVRDDSARHDAAEERAHRDRVETRDLIAGELDHQVIDDLYRAGLSLRGTLELVQGHEARSRLHDTIGVLDDLIGHIRTAVWSSVTSEPEPTN